MSDTLYREEYEINGGDFVAAGEASAKIKQALKQIGLNPQTVRRASIASYEAEINMIIHSYGGKMYLEITQAQVRVTCADTGPGIPDIDLAMQAGYSTAPDSIRMMGFGAGMGLPNIKKNTDQMQLDSSPAGTTLVMTFHI